MSNLNLKGLWIPIEVLTDKKLSDKEKHIYSLIIFLSQEKGYCFCTNKTISELLNISVTQVSKLVNSLKDKEYINIEMIYKENSKEVDVRKLIPIEEKFNSDKKWFDYENKVWANIKTTANEQEAWWVWIPRYAYKLPNTVNDDTEIIFIDTNNKPVDTEKYGETLPEGYTVHPAFDQDTDVNGNKLSGIWVCKCIGVV